MKCFNEVRRCLYKFQTQEIKSRGVGEPSVNFLKDRFLNGVGRTKVDVPHRSLDFIFMTF